MVSFSLDCHSSSNLLGFWVETKTKKRLELLRFGGLVFFRNGELYCYFISRDSATGIVWHLIYRRKLGCGGIGKFKCSLVNDSACHSFPVW